jgi:hypothetical protein
VSTGIIHDRPPPRHLGLPNFAAELYWAIRCEVAIGCWRMSDALPSGRPAWPVLGRAEAERYLRLNRQF